MQSPTAYSTGQRLAAGIILDTGQTGLDTGQDKLIAAELDTADFDHAHSDDALEVTYHEIHRIDGDRLVDPDYVTSTLKYFTLRVAAQSRTDGSTLFHLDGTQLVATLVYEDGSVVEELSATQEPPLLGDGGACPPKAVLDGGCASFRLRITVLTSLCDKRSFRVRVAADGRPALAVTTDAVKTLTKLRRTPRGESASKPKPTTAPTHQALLLGCNVDAPPKAAPARASAKRALAQMAMACAADAAEEDERTVSEPCLISARRDSFGCSLANELSKYSAELARCCDEATDLALEECLGADSSETLALPSALSACTPLTAYSVEELWEQVSANGSRLLELQQQQRHLFSELRRVRQACGLEGARDAE